MIISDGGHVDFDQELFAAGLVFGMYGGGLGITKRHKLKAVEFIDRHRVKAAEHVDRHRLKGIKYVDRHRLKGIEYDC
jgi:hypothetical protein